MAASLKVSELSALASVAAADLFLIADDDASASKKVTLTNLEGSISLANLGTNSINNLSDVDTSGIADGQYLAWNNSNSRFEAVNAAGSTVQTIQTATDATHYITFVDSDNVSATDESIYTDAGVTYNPSSNLLTVGELSATTLDIGGTNITATAAELNILDGATLTTTELNYVDGVTSSIQTQLDAKQASITDGDGLVFSGSTLLVDLKNDSATAITLTGLSESLFNVTLTKATNPGRISSNDFAYNSGTTAYFYGSENTSGEEYLEVTNATNTDFNGTYRRYNGFTLDTGTVASGSAAFHADTNYDYFHHVEDYAILLIYSNSDSDWVFVDRNGYSTIVDDSTFGLTSPTATELTGWTGGTSGNSKNQPAASEGDVNYTGGWPLLILNTWWYVYFAHTDPSTWNANITNVGYHLEGQELVDTTVSGYEVSSGIYGPGTDDSNVSSYSGGGTDGSYLEFASGELQARVLDEDNMASNSDTHLATQQSIKQYVDAQLVSGSGAVETTQRSVDAAHYLTFVQDDNVSATAETLHTDAGVTYNPSSNLLTAGEVSVTTLDIGGTDVTSTAAELNILDGVTADATELNILDGVTSTTAELNILDGVTADATELNILDGVTSTTAELNILDGVTATTTELNYVDGVTSAIQTQLDGKLVNVVEDTTPQLGGDLDAQSNKITGLADPTNDQDAATKIYVDEVAQGLTTKDAVRLATATALPAVTYANGTSGDGATLTADAVGALSVDSVSVALNDRILVKDQVLQEHNGIYYVSTLGDGSTAFVLTRALDQNAASEFAGAFCFVQEGTSNADSGYVCTTDNSVTVGTTDIVFTQFSGAGQVTAGTGLTKTGNTINAIGTTDRISVAADAIDIASTYVGQTSITTLGTIATGVWNGTSLTGTYIGNDEIDSQHYAAGSIDNEHLAVDSVDSDNYVDGSIDSAHLSLDAINSATLIADDVIDSEHYVAGSIDTEHIADDQVTAAKLADTAVTAASYGAAGTVGTFTVDAQGRLTAAADVAISITESQISDLTHATKASLDVDHLITLSGVADASDDLGTFTGTIIADNETVKGALQDLEDYLEAEPPVTVEVSNNTGGTLSKGQAVYISGTNGGGVMEVSLADNDGSGTMPAIGLIFADILDGNSGQVIIGGELEGLQTGSYTAGDALYVDATPGALTTTRPSGDTAGVQKIGIVTRANAGAGRILIIGAGRTNDVNNEITALTGVARLAVDLGTFTGTIITDNSDIKTALQELETEIELKAPLASPALTGTPTAPTAAADTNTTQIATTAFVQTQIGASTLDDLAVMDGGSPSADTEPASYFHLIVDASDGTIKLLDKTYVEVE